MYYEMHITMKGDKTLIKKYTEMYGWKFSAIDGDPTLGDGVKCYATFQYNSKYYINEAIDLLNATAKELKSHNVVILRRKIELVMYDEIDAD